MNNTLKPIVMVLMAGVFAASAQGLYEYNWSYSSSLYTG